MPVAYDLAQAEKHAGMIRARRVEDALIRPDPDRSWSRATPCQFKSRRLGEMSVCKTPIPEFNRLCELIKMKSAR